MIRFSPDRKDVIDEPFELVDRKGLEEEARKEGQLTFIYRDETTNEEFPFTASTQAAADKMFTQATGKSATKREDNITVTFGKPEKPKE